MILLLITILILSIIVFSKIQINFYVKNKDFKVILISLYVIKINLNAKASKGVKTLNNRTTSISYKTKIKIVLMLAKDILRKLKYLTGKTTLNLNVDCKYYILEPDKTAVIYGLASAVIYNVENLFRIFFKEYKSKLNLKPDFEGKNNNIKIEGNIKVRIIFLLILLIKILPIIFRYRKLIKSKGGEVNGSSDRRVNENYNG
jgi:hypothetical protein